MTRKIFAIMLACMMVFSLAACGKTVAPKDVPGTKEAQRAVADEPAKDAPSETPAKAAETEKNEEPAAFAKAPDIAGTAEEVAPAIDIDGCDTFTQIIDKKFTAGMGYANEQVGGTDVFFASSGTFDNLDGNYAAIDAALLIYKDGVPFVIGKIASGGTAYPITIAGDAIYTGSNHWMCKYEIEDEKLKLEELAYVNYDSNGNAAYGYEHDGKDMGLCNEDAEKVFNLLVNEMMEGRVVGFSTVS
ncbi:MAG: hypothetical protein E7300_05190 [Lachnospiraceae bacterium]|nr:hypothetical protein [Lachnospiraceae bacterium]